LKQLLAFLPNASLLLIKELCLVAI